MATSHTFVVLAYKESRYLEECIQSLMNQTISTNIVIATSTPNDFIKMVAEKYDMPIIENPEKNKGIGADFDFARTCVDSDLVTVAHQDDIYEKDYSKDIVDAFESNEESLIIFSNYFEICKGERRKKTLNLQIKRFLLFLSKFDLLNSFKLIKRNTIRFGNSICCPAVTYVNSNIKYARIFDSLMKSNIDWYAWEKLSKENGSFKYIDKELMGHRVHEESTTSHIIGDNTRTKEDFEMFQRFWPKYVANIIKVFYKKSEKSNKV